MRVPVWQNSIAPGDQIDVERALPPAFYSFALCIHLPETQVSCKNDSH